jgi:hypothetical protein
VSKDELKPLQIAKQTIQCKSWLFNLTVSDKEIVDVYTVVLTITNNLGNNRIVPAYGLCKPHTGYANHESKRRGQYNKILGHPETATDGWVASCSELG